ncbi:MAG: pyruvate dehydrogenase complex dihydrolipoamide acetyltransferase [Saprospiraceae bacterium]|nr:pyruvate dehydrogenase complex dihydrolipoamide acetyltransferase [Saprospiraceae bacterium]
MAEVIRMPRLSDTMEEGNIVSWLKKVGDNVEPGDVLAEVETDKATMELESYQEGVLLFIGNTGIVKVDDVIAVIGQPGEDFQSLLTSEKTKSAVPTSQPSVAVQEQVAESISQQAAPTEVIATSAAEAHDRRIKATPIAKVIASQEGVDLNSLKGSGDNGRIIKKDVEEFLSKPSQISEQKAPQTTFASTSDNFEDHPLSQMRKTIARRLSESMFTAPHFYLKMEINMDKAIEWRNQINAISDTRISFNDLVIRACAAALKNNPNVNSSWLGDRIRTNFSINIGVAVSVEDGLLVPVIHNADQKTLSVINKEVKILASKAKEKKLQPSEMQGNTFTISNLGMFDIEEFTAIINPPDACILAVGTIQQKPIVKDGNIVVGNIMKVSLSCDHRVVDGATGATFLTDLKQILEDPIRLII